VSLELAPGDCARELQSGSRMSLCHCRVVASDAVRCRAVADSWFQETVVAGRRSHSPISVSCRFFGSLKMKKCTTIMIRVKYASPKLGTSPLVAYYLVISSFLRCFGDKNSDNVRFQGLHKSVVGA